MVEFYSYFENGIWHIFNLFGCKHLLFLVVLTAPFVIKDWKKLLLLVSIFTLGNLLSLLLSLLGVLIIKGHLISLLTPIVTLLVAIFVIFATGKSSKPANMNGYGFVTLFMGIIHGLGFSNYFQTLLEGSSQSKWISVFEFSLGIEVAQILAVLLILLLAYLFQSVFRFSKRDWILVVSSFVIGIVLPVILRNEIWSRLN